jgi:hypothetical protein
MRLLALLALLMLGAPVQAAPPPAVPTDYANGFELHSTVTAPAYRVALDAAVYRQLQRGDLADLAVFNSAGQAVPQALERPEETASLPAQRPLPFYAIAQQGAQIAGPLTLRVDAGGAVVQMEAPGGAPESDGNSAWIIDAGEENTGITSLRLAWDGAPEGFLRHARLETGSELGAWQPLAEATLADLEHAGKRLVQDTLALPASPARYLRLRLDAGAAAGAGITLRTVLALSESDSVNAAEVLTPLTPVPDAETGAWLLDTGGPLPVERIRVRLPVDNDMAEFEILSRASETGPWQPRGQVLAYRLQSGDALLEGGDAPVDLRRDRYWRLQPVGTQRSAAAGEPRVEVGWTPDQVVFLARGGGPYTLAAGSGARQTDPQPLGTLWRSLPGGATTIEAATLGQMRELGGATALEPAREPVPWQRYLMWALLVGAVVALALMARSLLRAQHT